MPHNPIKAAAAAGAACRNKLAKSKGSQIGSVARVVLCVVASLKCLSV